MKNEKKDLLIIGGGALGAFHAYHALEMGLKVTLLEKDTAPKSASVRNFGQIVPSGMNQKWQAFGRKSLEVYAKLQSRADLGIMHGGSIYLASDAAELQLLEELAKINRCNDYPSELLTPKACLERYPCVQPWYCRGGLYFPQELSVNPRTMVHRLLALLQENPNFNYLPNTLAKSIDSGGATCKVSTANGDVCEAEQVILCSGTEFEHLYPGIFRNAGLELVKIQMARIKAQPNARIPGNILTGLTIRRYESFAECPSYYKIKATEDKDSFWKKWGIHLLFKQEADGSIILGDSHEYADWSMGETPDEFLREEVTRYFLDAGATILQLDHWEIENQWIGLYSQCKDQDIFQQTIDGKVHIVTGIGGKGMTGSAGFAFDHLSKLYGNDPNGCI
ncbi:MAG: TIGR03364 family FAD-dependent oxidoreductase [Saprospiraceae bacterium]